MYLNLIHHLLTGGVMDEKNTPFGTFIFYAVLAVACAVGFFVIKKQMDELDCPYQEEEIGI